MRTCRFALLAALMAVLSCEKPAEDQLVPPEKDAISFNFTFDFPTKAKKDKWEKEDVIFVFLNGAPSPKYLKMSYDGSKWSSQAMDGAAACASLELSGNSGHMRAVYLPFGGDATITNNKGAYQFSTACQSLFWTADMDYTVVNHTITANFDMHIPNGYVQFYVAGTGVSNGEYTLSTDAMFPTTLASVGADLSLNLDDGDVGGPMPGYVFKDGLLFSGRLNGSYPYSSYYFAKTGPGNTRADYFITPGSALESHDAVQLPANNSAKWQSVGASSTVSMVAEVEKIEYDCGTWYACDYHSTTPEGFTAEYYTYDEAQAAATAENKVLPSHTQITNLVTYCTWNQMSVHGNEGFVVVAKTGFLFFPGDNRGFDDTNYYWGGRMPVFLNAYFLQFSPSVENSATVDFCSISDSRKCQIRFVTGN